MNAEFSPPWALSEQDRRDNEMWGKPDTTGADACALFLYSLLGHISESNLNRAEFARAALHEMERINGGRF